MNKEMWEILVPASNNKDLKFTYEHHKEWDSFVKSISGGVTIMKTAKGEWISPSGVLFVDRMIPCRIVCTEEQIKEIIDFTIVHYNQEAVLAFRISDNVIIKHRTVERTEPYRPVNYILSNKEQNLWINTKCKLNIVPYRCGRQESCTGCPNLNE